jgi:hypothetical protein
LEAAQERAGAAEREAARLKKELATLKHAESAPELERPIPERFRRSDEDSVRVSWRWFRLSHLWTLFFAIVWDAILIGWYAEAIPAGDVGGLMVPLLHVAVGIGVTYSALTGLFNRTTLRADAGTLHVKHGPLPWRSNTRLGSDEIRQLYVHRNEHTDSDNDSKWSTYDVCALLTNGREKKLVKGLREHNEAAYLEHVAERALGIANARVPGEAKS